MRFYFKIEANILLFEFSFEIIKKNLIEINIMKFNMLIEMMNKKIIKMNTKIRIKIY